MRSHMRQVLSNDKRILVIGVEETIGRRLADYLYAQKFDVIGGVRKYSAELFNVKWPIILFDEVSSEILTVKINTIIIAVDYVWYRHNQDVLKINIANFMTVKRAVEIAKNTKIRIIYLSPKYMASMTRVADELLSENCIDYISLQLPEIVYSSIPEGWLPCVVGKLLNGGSVSVNALESTKNFLWLDDLCYFIEKIIERHVWEYKKIDLTASRRATNERILCYLGEVLNIKGTINVTITPYDGYDSTPMDDRKAREMGLYTKGTLEMVRRLLPDKIKDALGQSPYWTYERENINVYKDMIVHELGDLSSGELVNKELDYFYNLIKRKYKAIYIHNINTTYIAYFCFNLYMQAFENDDDEILHLFVPIYKYKNGRAIMPNYWLWGKCVKNENANVTYLHESNIRFWRYVFNKYKDDFVVCNDYTTYEVIRREMDYRYIPFAKDYIISFTRTEEEIAIECMKNMGVYGKDFICFHARDNAYNIAYKGRADSVSEYHDMMRNVDVEDYRLALDKLGEHGILSVRMGAAVDKSFSGNTIIDYANMYRTEMMDFYLMSHCKFFLCTNSGIMFMSMLFRTPMVLVDWVTIILNIDHMPPLTPERDLMIPKKVWNRREKRYLSLREILDFSITNWNVDIFKKYADCDCEIHGNTAEEIADVVLEMEERLSGQRIYSEKEEKLQAKYRDILMDAVERSHMHWTDARCGINFFKKNPWFLE